MKEVLSPEAQKDVQAARSIIINQTLLNAAQAGKIDNIRQLIALGADICVKNGDNATSLHVAAFHGHAPVVELLLKEGAVFEAKDNKGCTPLHAAACGGHKEVVKLLIESGAQVNVRSAKGITPLFFAALGGHREAVALLLENGADHQAKDSEEMTPLHVAAGGGHREAVVLLLENGASHRAKDNHGDTPLHSAAAGGHREVVALLLEKEADLHAQDNNKLTPLHRAANAGHAPVAALLIEKGADYQAKEGEFTPLHLAANVGHVPVVALLIEKGADYQAKDWQGKTPLYHAVSNGRKEIVDLLLTKGANPLIHAQALETFNELFEIKTALLKDFHGESRKELLSILDGLLDWDRTQEKIDMLVRQCIAFPGLSAVRELVDGVKEGPWGGEHRVVAGQVSLVLVRQETFFTSMTKGVKHYYGAEVEVPEKDVRLAGRGAVLHLREEIQQGIKEEQAQQQAFEGLKQENEGLKQENDSVKQENARLLALLAKHGISAEGVPSNSEDKGKEEVSPSSWAGRVSPSSQLQQAFCTLL